MGNVSAQEKHFVFIQSDAKQPFYVSVNGKLYSSTASGYLIIPKLADGNYSLTVGFAQNAFPEQTFNLAIQNKDLGFDLKNFNEKGWGLFNLQSLDITMASAANSNVVSQALNASSNSKALPPVISFEKKKDTAQAVSKPPVDTLVSNPTRDVEVKESIAKADPPPVKQVTAEATSTPDQPSKKPEPVAKAGKDNDIKKVSEVSGEEGVHLSYVEGTGKARDTVNIIIPSSPASSNTANSSPANTSSTKTDTETITQAKSSTSAANKSDVKFLDINMSGAKKDTVQSVKTTGDERRILENSNCKNIATDEDYAKLRKKMASETSDDKMIVEARKFYRNKCFTTSQIKGLSTLFLSDEGRFKFFETSFVSVADAGQYYTLQDEFIDPTFVNRFKGLLQ
ncbi:hypothetical protein SAE01_32260 [Segetibacter aerophilus]|uniref:DUF4476 domain-containing protein n=1 Tax=Segetibacter aerophilus TaxID=670293 RepID=A0A512BFJ3_9BACT|nr:hypothetical protein SAE01_32260 [Segetibacter aerophilus]